MMISTPLLEIICCPTGGPSYREAKGGGWPVLSRSEGRRVARPIAKRRAGRQSVRTTVLSQSPDLFLSSGINLRSARLILVW